MLSLLVQRSGDGVHRSRPWSWRCGGRGGHGLRNFFCNRWSGVLPPKTRIPEVTISSKISQMNSIADFFCLAVGVVASCETLIRLPFFPVIERLRRVAGRLAVRLRSTRVSDHWKAVAARRSAVGVVRITFLFVFFIVVSALPVIVASWVIMVSADGTQKLFLDSKSVIFSAIFSVIYFICKRRFPWRE